jgi:hypothetical protein
MVNSVDAAPIAVLTTATNGMAWPREKAPDITLKKTCKKREIYFN